MPYKIDKTSFTTQVGTYQVYETWKIPVVISGSIPNLNYNSYVAGFTFTQDNAKARAYVQNAAGLRAPITGGVRMSNYSPSYEIYNFASTEYIETDMYYLAGGDQVYVAIYIFNLTGGTVNLVTQTIDIIVEFYDGPVA